MIDLAKARPSWKVPQFDHIGPKAVGQRDAIAEDYH